MSEPKDYKVFWRHIDLDPLRQVFVYKVFKATNANTVRRLVGEGWKEEDPISDEHPMGLMTKRRARAYARELNALSIQRIDRHIEIWIALRRAVEKINNRLKEVIE